MKLNQSPFQNPKDPKIMVGTRDDKVWDRKFLNREKKEKDDWRIKFINTQTGDGQAKSDFLD